MSQYNQVIEDSVKSLLGLFNKLDNKDKNFAILQLTKLVNHANRSEKQRKSAIEKFKNIESDRYDDTLNFIIDIVALMGFNELELSTYIRDDFVTWFKNNALSNLKYQPKNITANILQSFGQAYRLYKMEYDKEPNSYDELRSFVIRFNDDWPKIIQNQVKQLTND